eukprot:3134573-Pyramimonas_sp.AAC.1
MDSGVGRVQRPAPKGLMGDLARYCMVFAGGPGERVGRRVLYDAGCKGELPRPLQPYSAGGARPSMLDLRFPSRPFILYPRYAILAPRSSMLHPRCSILNLPPAVIKHRCPTWVLRSLMHHLRTTPGWSPYDVKVIPQRNDFNATSQRSQEHAMNQWPTSSKSVFGRAVSSNNATSIRARSWHQKKTAAAKTAKATATTAVAEAAEAADSSSGRDSSEAPTLEDPGASVLLL